MARYSKEQRRRAAELYERYEHSAADVIRELGYPSKEALRMWHRDWLEERRTGIPSSRGEHYSRYTDGQRRAAVEHYLTHGRRLSEYLTCWGPGLLRLGAIMSFGGYCVSRPGLLRLGAVVG